MDKVLPFDVLTVFLSKEDTPGVAQAPLAAHALVLRAEGIKFPSQPNEYSKAREALATRSVTALAQNLRAAGSCTIPTYCRPSGVAGTAPGEDLLMTALLPDKTVNGGVSVVYKPKATKDSYTLWIVTANAVFFAVAAVVHGLKLGRDLDGFVTMDWDVSFRRLGHTGETQLNGAVDGTPAPVATCVVDDAEQTSIGSRLLIGNDPQVYRVTAIDYTTNTLTVDPPINTDQADNAAVIAAVPVPQAAVGTPLGARPAVKIGGAAIKWKSCELSISEAVNFVKECPEDPTQGEFPGEHVMGARDVTGSVRAVMRTSDVRRLRAKDVDVSFAIDWTGQAAGRKVLASCGQGRLLVPAPEAGDPSIEFSAPFEAKASAAFEDEIIFTYS